MLGVSSIKAQVVCLSDFNLEICKCYTTQSISSPFRIFFLPSLLFLKGQPPFANSYTLMLVSPKCQIPGSRVRRTIPHQSWAKILTQFSCSRLHMVNRRMLIRHCSTILCCRSHCHPTLLVALPRVFGFPTITTCAANSHQKPLDSVCVACSVAHQVT